MYYVIETKEQLALLPRVERCFIDLVALSEEAHPILTQPCVIYYNDFDKGYILSVNHSEGFSLPIDSIQAFLASIPTVYLLNKKWHSYFLLLPQAVDLNFSILSAKGELKDLKCYTNVHLDFYNKFKYKEEVNTYIPISKHYERCECMFENIKEYVNQESNVEWQNKYVEAYRWVEEQGIAIQERVFDKFFEPTWKSRSIKQGKVYTSYNLYNITSRPTNAFNGINFLAFNKDNGSRTAYIPSNDIFVEFDFDGYHIRLIANKLGIPLPSGESIHTVLGREYFKKQELSTEEYQESKKITFRQLYNGIESEYEHISFFNQVNKFVYNLWSEYKERGYLQLPNGRTTQVENPTPQKLFNYYVQCLETVNNVEKLIALRDLLQGKKSKVVLVVYDSILVDYCAEDGLLKQIKEVLEEGGYKVKAQKGYNYGF